MISTRRHTALPQPVSNTRRNNGFKKKVIPNWYSDPTPTGTWRSLFKWGDPAAFKHPNSGLVRLIMDTFDLTEEQLKHPLDLGLGRVDIDAPVTLDPQHIQTLTAICGEENISTDVYTRIKGSYGYGMIDALRLRKHIVENLPDLVIAPRSGEEIQQIVDYCDQTTLPSTFMAADPL